MSVRAHSPSAPPNSHAITTLPATRRGVCGGSAFVCLFVVPLSNYIPLVIPIWWPEREAPPKNTHSHWHWVVLLGLNFHRKCCSHLDWRRYSPGREDATDAILARRAAKFAISFCLFFCCVFLRFSSRSDFAQTRCWFVVGGDWCVVFGLVVWGWVMLGLNGVVEHTCAMAANLRTGQDVATEHLKHTVTHTHTHALRRVHSQTQDDSHTLAARTRTHTRHTHTHSHTGRDVAQRSDRKELTIRTHSEEKNYYYDDGGGDECDGGGDEKRVRNTIRTRRRHNSKCAAATFFRGEPRHRRRRRRRSARARACACRDQSDASSASSERARARA